MLKQKNYRNRDLLNLARESPRCMGCLRPNDGTVVAAHANWEKGTGLKSSDLPAYLCDECHYEVDNGKKWTKEQRQLYWSRAFFRTMEWLFSMRHLVVK